MIRKYQIALLLVLSLILVTSAFAQTAETGAITFTTHLVKRSSEDSLSRHFATFRSCCLA